MDAWIEGDIDGLRNLAETLRAYVPHVRDLTGRLSAVARNLTGDDTGGWQGAAADAFTATWHRQAKSAAALEDYVTAAAQAIGDLADELSRARDTAARDPGRAVSEANAAREAAARRLGSLRRQATDPGAHPDGAMAALLAGGLAAGPLAALGRSGHAEAGLTRLVDTPVIDARATLQGTAALGRHAAGRAPDGPAAAGGEEPEALKGVLGAAEKVPVLDIGATVVGAAAGSYYDIEDGQSPETAIPGELISNGAGTVAADAGGALAGTVIGARLGAAGGPVGVAAGAVIGYGVGDLTHNLMDEHWTADVQAHGVIGGAAHGAHHAADQTADDARELGVQAGHQAEHYTDDLFGG